MDEEAAYWAAYSVVQGSADSTIPSRVPSLPKLNTIWSAAHGDDSDIYAHGHRQYDTSRDSGRYGQDDEKNDHGEPLAMGAVRSRCHDSHLDELGPASSAGAARDPLKSDSNGGVGERILHRFSPELEERQQERERKISEKRDASDATALAKALFPVVSYQQHLENLEEQKNQSPKVIANAVPGLDIVVIADGARRLPDSSGVPNDTDTVDAVPEDAAQLSSSESTAVSSETKTVPSSEMVGAVEEAVRGVYRLWLTQNQSATNISVTAEKLTREAFLALVANAISPE